MERQSKSKSILLDYKNVFIKQYTEILSKMKKFINWLKDDWKNNRFRLFCETVGSLCFIAIYVLMAWYGESVSIMNIFLIQLVGSTLHIINAYLRNSVNLIALNCIVIAIALFGLAKMALSI